jgi:tetratricopeptide (TPR) repeat protein
MSDRPPLSAFQVIQLVLLGVIAFSTGGILMWLLLSNNAKPPEVSTPATPVAQPADQSAFTAVREHQLAQAPNVSGIDPKEAALTLANWSFDHKAWSEAISQYQKAIALGSDNPDVRTDLGSAYRFSGQFEKAIEQYQIANRQNPQHENSLFNLASLYLQNLRQPNKAIALLEDFEHKFPQSGALPRVHELLNEARHQTQQ